ncbi:type II toxin-antitoxin system HicA family toxin [Brachyspira sp.]|uniref:type II toxin-antitoxin system HicA family toxin n=1 Tax=Brachyspira sp. TaxID=1977261 RepID=UPI003D7E5B43
MSRLILKDAKTIEKLLLMLGFVKKRQKGSHAFYKHIDGISTVIPFHSNKNIARPLLRKILSEISLEIDEYNDLIEKL